MDLRDFRKWLLEKKLQEDELFIESINCYNTKAYRASYLFSYLAFLRKITNDVLKYNGIPEKYCPFISDETEREKKWIKEIEHLNNDNKWEDKIFELMETGSERNIFKIQDNNRTILQDMKHLRNSAAHNKNRNIYENTILSLWDNIVYLNELYVVGGSLELWIRKLDEISKYSNLLKSDITKLSNELYNDYFLFPNGLKKKAFKDISDRMIKLFTPDLSNIFNKDQYSDEVLILIFEKIFSINNADEYKWVVPKLEVCLTVCLKEYRINCEEIDYLDAFKDLGNIEIFDDKSEQVIIGFYNKIYNKFKKSKNNIINYFVRTIHRNRELEFKELIIDDYNLLKDETLISIMLLKIKKIYTYRNSINIIVSTSTFDYVCFSGYLSIISLLFRIYSSMSNEDFESLDEKLKNGLNDFIGRCELLLETNYSDSENGMLSMKKDIEELKNSIIK